MSDETFERLHMELVPLVAPVDDPDLSPREVAKQDGAAGVLTLNSLRIECPMDAESRTPGGVYFRDNLITMCASSERGR